MPSRRILIKNLSIKELWKFLRFSEKLIKTYSFADGTKIDKKIRIQDFWIFTHQFCKQTRKIVWKFVWNSHAKLLKFHPNQKYKEKSTCKNIENDSIKNLILPARRFPPNQVYVFATVSRAGVLFCRSVSLSQKNQRARAANLPAQCSPLPFRCPSWAGWG